MTAIQINELKASKRSLNTVSPNDTNSALVRARTKGSVYQLNGKPIAKQIIDPNNERTFEGT